MSKVALWYVLYSWHGVNRGRPDRSAMRDWAFNFIRRWAVADSAVKSSVDAIRQSLTPTQPRSAPGAMASPHRWLCNKDYRSTRRLYMHPLHRPWRPIADRCMWFQSGRSVIDGIRHVDRRRQLSLYDCTRCENLIVAIRGGWRAAWKLTGNALSPEHAHTCRLCL